MQLNAFTESILINLTRLILLLNYKLFLNFLPSEEDDKDGEEEEEEDEEEEEEEQGKDSEKKSPSKV